MQNLKINDVFLIVVVVLVVIGVILLAFNTIKKYRYLNKEEHIKLRDKSLDKASTSIIIKLILELFAGK